jgi:hypothetical protein
VTQPTEPNPQPPPRAFGQGVGTVYQAVGIVLFLGSIFVCCGSSLMSKATATKTFLTQIGWFIDRAWYGAQFAVTITLAFSLLIGMALATIGLGLQAQNRKAPILAVVTTAIATLFWTYHVFYFVAVHLLLMSVISAVMLLLCAAMFLLAIGAWSEMRRNPTPAGFEILPADYKVPYSHMHQDPPEVRLERELDQRRQRLAVQQKELELLEEKLRRKMKEKDSQD